MNKGFCLSLSILEISKIVMHKFWYNYVKPKYNEQVKLCYMDTDTFVAHVQKKDIYQDNTKNVEKRFDTSNYELERLLPKRKKQKCIALMKDGLGGKII